MPRRRSRSSWRKAVGWDRAAQLFTMGLQAQGVNLQSDDLLGLVTAADRQRGYSDLYTTSTAFEKAVINATAATGVSLVTFGLYESPDDLILSVTDAEREHGYGTVYMVAQDRY